MHPLGDLEKNHGSQDDSAQRLSLINDSMTSRMYRLLHLEPSASEWQKWQCGLRREVCKLTNASVWCFGCRHLCWSVSVSQGRGGSITSDMVCHKFVIFSFLLPYCIHTSDSFLHLLRAQAWFAARSQGILWDLNLEGHLHHGLGWANRFSGARRVSRVSRARVRDDEALAVFVPDRISAACFYAC